MMKQNAGKRIDNILIKLPESMRDRIEKLPAQTLQQLEEIRIRTNTDTLLISGGREYSLMKRSFPAAISPSKAATG